MISCHVSLATQTVFTSPFLPVYIAALSCIILHWLGVVRFRYCRVHAGKDPLLQDDQVVDELGCILDEIKEKRPLLEDVANPAFQPRHWIEIHELLGTLETYCPVEVERRRRLEDAQATGDPADLADLVRN